LRAAGSISRGRWPVSSSKKVASYSSFSSSLSYEITPTISGGLEYYGGIGPVTAFDPLRRQQQPLFPVLDLNLGPQWECNFGVGFGLTPATDRLLVKLIVGYRFGLGSGGRKGS